MVNATLSVIFKHCVVVILICLLAFYDALCWVLMDKKALVQRDDMLLKTRRKKATAGHVSSFLKAIFCFYIYTLNVVLRVGNLHSV